MEEESEETREGSLRARSKAYETAFEGEGAIFSPLWQGCRGGWPDDEAGKLDLRHQQPEGGNQYFTGNHPQVRPEGVWTSGIERLGREKGRHVHLGPHKGGCH